MKSKLIFFTAEYPYGNKSETFIENEIDFLATKFQEVIIIPSYKTDDKIRRLPQNVNVNNIFIENVHYNRKKVFFRYFLRIFSTFFSEFLISDNLLNYIKKRKYYVDLLCIQCNRLSLLKKLFENEVIGPKDVLYDFWYSNSALALSFLKKDGFKNKIIIRAHRYDLYDEESETGRVPFRNFISKNVSKIVFSNTHGKQYFLSRVRNVDLKKISVNYLGVYDKNIITQSEKVKREGFTLVSCSGVSHRKRVDLIPQILSRLSHKITWIHLGDGALMDQLQEQCKFLPSNIKCVFKGHVDNQSVIEFYQNNHVDLFVAFTTSEGLPVSYKEAISFGIPIFSTNVCGIPDIINRITGEMVNVDEDIDIIVEKINHIIQSYPFNEIDIKNYFKKNFLADKVYPNFIDTILLDKEFDFL
jgi:colanic acid/amylovoran biosynthesis glycosyltransferase